MFTPNRLAMLNGWLGLGLALLLSLIATAFFIHYNDERAVISAEPGMTWTHIDLAPVWIGSRLILRRQDPYSEQATRAIQTKYYGRPLCCAEDYRWNKMGFAYPPHTALVFAPLALLPWGWAGWAVLLLAPPLIAFSIVAWMRLTEARSNPILVIAAVFASLPFLWGLRLENVTLLVVPLIAAGCLLLKDRPVIAGVLLAMSTVKPQLVFLLVAFLVVWSIIHHAWSFLASFALTLSAMLLAATLLLPGWFHLWRASMADYVTYTHVSVLLTWPMEGALLLLVFAVLWKLRHDFGAAISLALAATLAAIPVNLPTTYNYLLLIPACLILLDARPDGKLAPVLRQIALLSIVANLSYRCWAMFAHSFSREACNY